MKIAYLGHRVPYPPNKGEKIRAFHQLCAMAGRHEVDMFTLADDPADLAHQSVLSRYCRTVTVRPLHRLVSKLCALPYLLTSKPLTLPYFYSESLQQAFQHALKQRSYDRIFIYCSAMAQYVETVKDIPIITDMVDVDSNKWTQYSQYAGFPSSFIYRREGQCLARFEKRVCDLSTDVLVTTEREASLLKDSCPSANVHVIPVGVDPALLAHPPGQQANRPVILFVGDMSYFPNQDAVTSFVRSVFPSIRRSVPDARFLIVGRNPSRSVRQLTRIHGVEVTGSVPGILPYLSQARVSVAPFSVASGIQTKVLEAMAFGLPVVATVRATQGLAHSVAAHVVAADAPSDMAAAVSRYLLDPVWAQTKGREGQRSVALHYDRERSLSRLLDIIEHPGRNQNQRVNVSFAC